MAAHLGSSKGDLQETHEINVTPFIDVMLVLLIIFMIAAPLATVDLPVDLPASNAAPHEKPDKPVYVTIQADLALALGETPVKRNDLVKALDALGGDKNNAHIPARRQRGALWRDDGRSRTTARRRLS